MPVKNTPTGNWKQRLLADLKADKRKAALLAVLAVVAAVVIARMTLRGGAPSPARAALATATPPAVAAPRASAAPTDQAPPRAAPARSPASPEAHRFARDIFLPNPDFFPPAEPAQSPKLVGATQPASPESEEESLRKSVQAQARSLMVQSTMISAQPTAIINGRVLRVGEWITGFEVVSISARGCVVRRSGVSVALEMRSN